MFCPKCGSLLRPKKEKGKKVLYCTCGYTKKDAEPTEIKETMEEPVKEVEVVSEDDQTLPETEAACPKCKNHKAFYWMQQTRAGDEPETRFLRCTQCKHTWREYK